MQLTFDLPCQTAYSRADFMVSEANILARRWVDRWPAWPSRVLALHGPVGCGKTHLVSLWCAQASASAVSGRLLSDDLLARLAVEPGTRIAVDDADCAPERLLLHLHNLCLENQGFVLLASRRPPIAWSTGLPDLRSRLGAVVTIGIAPPDDALLEAVLVKHFADRQLRVAPEVIAHLVSHMERSFAAAADLAARLDLASLRDRREITVPLVRRILSEASDNSLQPKSDLGSDRPSSRGSYHSE
jgi:chromosomal replication initiation ATPase DnaA